VRSNKQTGKDFANRIPIGAKMHKGYNFKKAVLTIYLKGDNILI